MVSADLHLSIIEEIPHNTIISNIKQEARLDQQYHTDILELLQFSFLTQPQVDGTHFGINQAGHLYTVGRIDRESMCPQQPDCTVTFDLAIRPLQYFQIIKISMNILDINDNTPTFPDNTLWLNISESTSEGTSFSIPAAVDGDSELNSVQSYTLLSSSELFELIQSKTIDGSTDVKIVLRGELDREVMDHYLLEVVAADGGEPSRSGVLTIQINVMDSNDNPPKFEEPIYEISVEENTHVNTAIKRVIATDPDLDLNSQIYFEFDIDTQNHYGNVFAIDTQSGIISLQGDLDYENSIIHLLTVLAKDKGSDPLTSTCQIIVRVTDVNDNAPEMKVNTLTSSGVPEVMENLPKNTFVAHISVTDKDTGVNSQVTCVMENDQNFNLVNLYKAEYQVMTGKVFDREVVDEYQLMILCSDQGQIPLTTSSSIYVQIIDANDHTPVFTSEKYSTVIEENNALETTLAQLQATDSDVGDNGQIIYEILPEYKNLVNIDSNTGLVTAATSFDYEQTSLIMIVVKASDRGVPPRTSTCSLEVTFLDEDDEYPVFSQKTYSLGVYENEPKFTKVGTVMAIDSDSDHYNKFHYTLDPYGEDVDKFHIDSDTGVIVIQTVLDREVKSVYVMTVMAVPQNKPEYSSSASVTVHVADVNDNSPVFLLPNLTDHHLYVAGDAPQGYVLDRLHGTDADSGLNSILTYHIQGGSGQDIFSVDITTGAIYTSTNLMPHVGQMLTINVTAKDSGKLPLAESVNVSIHVTPPSNSPRRRVKSLLSDNMVILLAFGLAALLVIVVLSITIIVIIGRRWRHLCHVSDSDKESTNNHDNAYSAEVHTALKDPHASDFYHVENNTVNNLSESRKQGHCLPGQPNLLQQQVRYANAQLAALDTHRYGCYPSECHFQDLLSGHSDKSNMSETARENVAPSGRRIPMNSSDYPDLQRGVFNEQHLTSSDADSATTATLSQDLDQASCLQISDKVGDNNITIILAFFL